MTYEKILIVEEDLQTASDLADTLVESGFTVVGVVSSGESALSMVEKMPLDIILMDFFLKGSLDGVTTGAKIQDCTDLPIIYMAPNSSKDLIIRAKYILPYGYLTKPVAEQDLLAIIRRALIWHTWGKISYDYEDVYHSIFREVSESTDWEVPVTSIKTKIPGFSSWQDDQIVN